MQGVLHLPLEEAGNCSPSPPSPCFTKTAGVTGFLGPSRAVLVFAPLHCASGISYFSYKFLEMLYLLAHPD